MRSGCAGPGWVEQEELAAFYALAEALLLPSLFEACPLPLLEAMAAGLPDRHGGPLRHQGAGGRGGGPGESGGRREHRWRASAESLDDGALRAELVAAGRERSREFTWRRCATETLRVLEQVGPARRPAPRRADVVVNRETAAATDPIEVMVNARHLAGPRTGTEVYMEQLLAALARTGQVRITALTWAPLGLDQPGLREWSRPAPRLPAGRGRDARAMLWKLWFDQWHCLRAVGRLRVASSTTAWMASCRTPCAGATAAWRRCTTSAGRRIPSCTPGSSALMYGALFPWVVRRADRFIAVSRYTADDLVRRAGVPASRIEVVYHGLDPAFT